MGPIRPPAIRRGDRLAAVSLSWGGAAVFPARYQVGKRQLEEALGVTVVDGAHACADPLWLERHPEARAQALMQAFADPSIRGIVSTIGGDDSIRLLPYLDLDVIRRNPKVFLGYSDTTVSHFACAKAGLTSFYGPSILAGFAENGGLFDYMIAAVRAMLCSTDPAAIPPNAAGWTCDRSNWGDPSSQHVPRPMRPVSGWQWLQGEGVHRGRLMGGCVEIVDWLRGTPVWPSPEEWRDTIVFLELSEECPSPKAFTRMLRSLGAAGVLHGARALLFGRPYGDDSTFAAYDAVLQQTCRDLALDALPIVTHMDFGHTDPMCVLPYGVLAEVDCDRRTVRLVEPAVS
jgi:muramoyltetrapeptide carboxypeptidase LdcA involved in peptidoglycan recycling